MSKRGSQRLPSQQLPRQDDRRDADRGGRRPAEIQYGVRRGEDGHRQRRVDQPADPACARQQRGERRVRVHHPSSLRNGRPPGVEPASVALHSSGARHPRHRVDRLPRRRQDQPAQPRAAGARRTDRGGHQRLWRHQRRCRAGDGPGRRARVDRRRLRLLPARRGRARRRAGEAHRPPTGPRRHHRRGERPGRPRRGVPADPLQRSRAGAARRRRRRHRRRSPTSTSSTAAAPRSRGTGRRR